MSSSNYENKNSNNSASKKRSFHCPQKEFTNKLSPHKRVHVHHSVADEKLTAHICAEENDPDIHLYQAKANESKQAVKSPFCDIFLSSVRSLLLSLIVFLECSECLVFMKLNRWIYSNFSLLPENALTRKYYNMDMLFYGSRFGKRAFRRKNVVTPPNWAQKFTDLDMKFRLTPAHVSFLQTRLSSCNLRGLHFYRTPFLFKTPFQLFSNASWLHSIESLTISTDGIISINSFYDILPFTNLTSLELHGDYWNMATIHYLTDLLRRPTCKLIRCYFSGGLVYSLNVIAALINSCSVSTISELSLPNYWSTSSRYDGSLDETFASWSSNTTSTSLQTIICSETLFHWLLFTGSTHLSYLSYTVRIRREFAEKLNLNIVFFCLSDNEGLYYHQYPHFVNLINNSAMSDLKSSNKTLVVFIQRRASFRGYDKYVHELKQCANIKTAYFISTSAKKSFEYCSSVDDVLEFFDSR